MYILYLDESGTHGEASYFILAGLAAFEREIHWFSQDLDAIQQEYFPGNAVSIYFHATKLRTRADNEVEKPWDGLTTEKKLQIKDKIYDVIRTRRGVLFGCAVEKRYSQLRNEDPYEHAFEDVISRFDRFLSRVNRQANADGKEEQRGLVVLAESSYEKTITLLGRRLRERGIRWGVLHNVADVPLFAPAQDTRLLQYADFCANAIYGRYHAGLTGDFDRIASKFDQEGRAIHGLVHLITNPDCLCVACFSRRGYQSGFTSTI